MLYEGPWRVCRALGRYAPFLPRSLLPCCLSPFTVSPSPRSVARRHSLSLSLSFYASLSVLPSLTHSLTLIFKKYTHMHMYSYLNRYIYMHMNVWEYPVKSTHTELCSCISQQPTARLLDYLPPCLLTDPISQLTTSTIIHLLQPNCIETASTALKDFWNSYGGKVTPCMTSWSM